jgi:hypothetical protein
MADIMQKQDIADILLEKQKKAEHELIDGVTKELAAVPAGANKRNRWLIMKQDDSNTSAENTQDASEYLGSIVKQANLEVMEILSLQERRQVENAMLQCEKEKVLASWQEQCLNWIGEVRSMVAGLIQNQAILYSVIEEIRENQQAVPEMEEEIEMAAKTEKKAEITAVAEEELSEVEKSEVVEEIPEPAPEVVPEVISEPEVALEKEVEPVAEKEPEIIAATLSNRTFPEKVNKSGEAKASEAQEEMPEFSMKHHTLNEQLEKRQIIKLRDFNSYKPKNKA